MQIIESGNRAPKDMVTANKADFALISKRYPIDDSLNFKQIISDRMIVCVPVSSYLAQLDVVRFSDLAEWPLAMPLAEFSENEASSFVGRDMASQIRVEFEKRGIEPKVFISTQQSRLTRILGAESNCAYFQPTMLNASDPALNSGNYVSKELETVIPCIYGILYLKSHPSHPKTAPFRFTLKVLEEELFNAFESEPKPK